VSPDEVEIVPCRDGPYLVSGPAVLRDQDGREIYVDRRTMIALCRCGRSRTRPFCDGTHQWVRFKATSEAEPKHPHGSDIGVVMSDGKPSRLSARTNGSIKKGLQDAVANTRAFPASDDSIMQAVSLLSAARVLLAANPASTGDGEDPDWAIPCICLLRGTIAALAQSAGGAVREVPDVIEQLSVLVARLEARSGHE
jgi:CDGSH-type Zn-finger protein